MFVPVSQPPRPSPEARVLSQRIDAAIREFLAENPRTSDLEVLQALELLRRQREKARGARMRGEIAGLVGGLLVAAALGGLVLWNTGGGGAAEALPWAVVALVAALLVILGVVVARRRG